MTEANLKRRTDLTVQQLANMIFSPELKDTLRGKTYSHWDVGCYIRHNLRNVPLQDLSVVDRLIMKTGPSLKRAILTCLFIHIGPGGAIASCLQSVVDSPTAPAANLDSEHSMNLMSDTWEQHTQLREEPKFNTAPQAVEISPNLRNLHGVIVLGCLRTMNEHLCFNICSIPTSYIANDSYKMEKLFQNTQHPKNLFSALIYACTHWAYHASMSPPGDQLIAQGILFLDRHALHWLEVLSLARQNPLTIIPHLLKLRVSKD